MKMVMISYDEAIDDEVMEILDKSSAKYYSKISQTLGSGKHSGIHLGNDVWPGKNNMLFIACQEDVADRIISRLWELHNSVSHLGVKAFKWDLDEVPWHE